MKVTNENVKNSANVKKSEVKMEEENGVEILENREGKRSRKILLMILISVVAAVILTFLMQWRYFMNDFGTTWDFVVSRPRVFFFNAWLMFLIINLFTFVLGGVWRGVGATSVLVLIVSYINLSKLLLRGVPLLPEDLQLASQAGAIASFVNITSLIGLIAAIALAVLIVALLAKLFKKWKIKIRLAYRVAGVIFVAALFVSTTVFAWHNAGQKYEYIDWLDTTFTAWDQNKNYEENGFLIGFIYNWSKFDLKKPEGYSEKALEKIRTELEEKAKKVNEEGKNTKEPDYNIVLVLNESFIDFKSLAQYYPYSGSDVTPNLHEIMRKNPSGYLYSPDYGGGTANIEFEVVTGLTNYWVDTVPYTSLIPKAGEIPTYASWAAENGYATTAVHAYNSGMYKRNIVLPNEGFENFITQDEYKYTDKEDGNNYINDKSSYKEVLDVLKASDKKQLVLTITMQNHTPYGGSSGEFTLESAPSGDEERKESIEKYLTSLHKSDEYLRYLVDEIDAMAEKTVLIFFGDHAPGLFYELDSSEDENEVALTRATPYFVHANFDMGETVQQLPTTTPNCIVNTALNLLDAKKPLLGYLLDTVCSEAPVLTARYLGDAGLKESESLKEYELITYDLLGGEKYFSQK